MKLEKLAESKVGQSPVFLRQAFEILTFSRKQLENGATSVTVKSRSETEELFLRKYKGARYRNTIGTDGIGIKQLFGRKTKLITGVMSQGQMIEYQDMEQIIKMDIRLTYKYKIRSYVFVCWR